MIRTYFEMLLTELTTDISRAPEREAAGKMKQFASWFTHGVPGGSSLRKAIFEAKSGNAILDAVKRFFEREEQLPFPAGSGVDCEDAAPLPASLMPETIAAECEYNQFVSVIRDR
jgi:hypothetical protein